MGKSPLLIDIRMAVVHDGDALALRIWTRDGVPIGEKRMGPFAAANFAADAASIAAALARDRAAELAGPLPGAREDGA